MGQRKWRKSQSEGKQVEVVWACNEKRGVLVRKEVKGSESTREKEERKTKEKMVGQSEG